MTKRPPARPRRLWGSTPPASPWPRGFCAGGCAPISATYTRWCALQTSLSTAPQPKPTPTRGRTGCLRKDHPGRAAQRLHTDPIVHAYAITARRCGFQREHLVAFFSSMRADLTQREYSPSELQDYIYGSAEAIGLLCLQIFLAEENVSPADRAAMERGARALGSAFQKINFLRDLREDSSTLGRTYFQQAPSGRIDEATKSALIAEIRRARHRRAHHRLASGFRAGGCERGGGYLRRAHQSPRRHPGYSACHHAGIRSEPHQGLARGPRCAVAATTTRPRP